VEDEKMSLDQTVKDCQTVINAILKELHSSLLKTSDISILSLFISQRRKADTINLLYKSKRYSEIQILERSFLEQEVYFKFILEKNTAERGKVFYLHQKYTDLVKVKQALDSLSNREEAKEQWKIVNKEIKNDKSVFKNFQDIYDNFEIKYKQYFPNVKLRELRRLPWYSFEDSTHKMRIFELMKSQGMGDLYFGIYKVVSDDVHGSRAPGLLKLLNVDKEKQIAHLAETVPIPTNELQAIRTALEGEMMLLIKYYKIMNSEKIKDLITKIQINAYIKNKVNF
jgi:hypothetical protein